MSHEALMREAYERINDGDVDGFGELLRDDFVEHEDIGGAPPTKEGVQEFFRMLLAAFSDHHFEPEDMIASDDKVVTRFRFTGTHSGEFLGVPATGKSVDIQGVDIVRFDDEGKGVEHWGVSDTLTMLQQLGAVPAPA
jgi:steroid delta-isomerase-like uncharacterized protein